MTSLRRGIVRAARCDGRCVRGYHSFEHPQADIYTKVERQILEAGMKRVPTMGFSLDAISSGAQDSGYLEATRTLFPEGAWALVRYHLVQERMKLAIHRDALEAEKGIGRKIRHLCIARLKGNATYMDHWQQALALGALPQNLKSSSRELWDLSDEMWHLVDDKSADMSWYTKRASLSAVYASTDMFMVQDRSPEMQDTIAFLDRRLYEVHTLGASLSGMSTFVGFQVRQFGNILASKGIKF